MAEKSDGVLKFLNTISPVKGEDLLGFSRALAQMVEGGISLKRAMDILYQDIENPALKRVVNEIGSRMEGGESLSSSLEGHTDIFDQFFRAMVKAGESSGNLPEMLRRLGDHIEVTEEMKAKAKSALLYPFLLLIFSALAVGTLLAIGVPYLDHIYTALDLSPPLYTSIVVGIGGMMGQHLTLLFVATIGLMILAGRFFKSPKGREMADQMRLKLPVLSYQYRLLYTARFARTLGTLYQSGIPLQEALTHASATIGNKQVAEELDQAINRVKGGETLSACLRGSPNFDRMAVGMMAAGEESGSLDAMLKEIADLFESKVYTALNGLASTVEPLLMVCVGLGVAALVLAMGLPFMGLASSLV